MAMDKLITVERNDGSETPLYWDDINVEATAYHPPSPPQNQNRLTMTNVSLWLVKPKDVDRFVKYAAEKNPGCEIQVWHLEKVGQCPAGDFVQKDVTKDGILPA